MSSYMIPTVLLSFKDKVYRPAGYRIPLLNELYISTDGRPKLMSQLHNQPLDIRLIIREYDSSIDFRGSTLKEKTHE